MTNWMPGPYEVAKRGTYPDDEGFKVLGPELTNASGKPYRLYVAQYIPTEATANLFSAGPELYDALFRILTESIVRTKDHGLLDRAYTALAKARGESEVQS